MHHRAMVIKRLKKRWLLLCTVFFSKCVWVVVVVVVVVVLGPSSRTRGCNARGAEEDVGNCFSIGLSIGTFTADALIGCLLRTDDITACGAGLIGMAITGLITGDNDTGERGRSP
eukprot:TRINITY_DN2715_c1_g1_i1.p2 TRINITY_DN2715_c1_g1~~TRINITY_DN2715_c1_g1_i1.p2  ORF type:complete len:115 (-),score=9.21 TRINITY_DN2715_c1_g1_i1:147-491(-)